MTVSTELTRLKTSIANAYDALEAKGAIMPAIENSDNLANTVESIAGGGGAKIYKYTNIVVPIENFVADETYPDYSYKADIELVDAHDDVIATVNFSLEDAQSGNYASVNLCGEGIVTIYAKKVPTSLTIPSILIR